MKTLFITSFNPFISRNILATDVFKILKSQSDLRIVIFVPDYKTNYFQERFFGSNVTIEGIVAEKVSRQDVIFTYLNSSLVDSQTLAIHKREKLGRDKNYFKFALSFILRKIFSRFNSFKKLIRFLDGLCVNTRNLDSYFSKYQPAAVFVTDVFNNDDVHFLAAARKREIRAIGMIRSWDNITTKGIFRVKPEKLIVHNAIIQNEAIRHNVMKLEEVFVSGIPQYDRYFNGRRMNRQEFFSRIGLDPSRKLILFSPFGDRFFKYDWQIMEILKELNEQVLVRLTPNDKVNLERFKPSKLFYVDQPGHQFKTGYSRDSELDEKDTEWLADSLFHSDVLVACGTSVVIDAAVFGKPSVLIYFDGFEKNLPYLKSAIKNKDFDHVQYVLRGGGARPARNKEELFQNVREFLSNPQADRNQRQAVLEEQVYKLDGAAGQRIANFILENI